MISISFCPVCAGQIHENEPEFRKCCSKECARTLFQAQQAEKMQKSLINDIPIAR